MPLPSDIRSLSPEEMQLLSAYVSSYADTPDEVDTLVAMLFEQLKSGQYGSAMSEVLTNLGANGTNTPSDPNRFLQYLQGGGVTADPRQNQYRAPTRNSELERRKAERGETPTSGTAPNLMEMFLGFDPFASLGADPEAAQPPLADLPPLQRNEPAFAPIERQPDRPYSPPDAFAPGLFGAASSRPQLNPNEAAGFNTSERAAQFADPLANLFSGTNAALQSVNPPEQLVSAMNPARAPIPQVRPEANTAFGAIEQNFGPTANVAPAPAYAPTNVTPSVSHDAPAAMINWNGHNDGLTDPLLAVLSSAQSNLPFSLNVTSGHRDASRNAFVGGASRSEHLSGNAADVSLNGLNDVERAFLVQELAKAGALRLGAYSGNTGLHIDMADNYASPEGYSAYPMFDRSIRNMDSAPQWFKTGLNPQGYLTLDAPTPATRPENLTQTPFAPSAGSPIRLSPQEMDFLARAVQTEVDPRLLTIDPEAYAAQARGIADTIFNRMASSQYPNSLVDVLNERNQFSLINGPAKGAFGSVQNIPADSVNPKLSEILGSWVNERANGTPSSIGGHLNYGNPNASSQSWINNLDGPKLGVGPYTHNHGTAFNGTPIEATLAPFEAAQNSLRRQTSPKDDAKRMPFDTTPVKEKVPSRSTPSAADKWRKDREKAAFATTSGPSSAKSQSKLSTNAYVPTSRPASNIRPGPQRVPTAFAPSQDALRKQKEKEKAAAQRAFSPQSARAAHNMQM